MKFERTLILILALITVLSMPAQQKRQYIYLLDCSESVFRTYNDSSDIWKAEMKYLKNAIEQNTDLSDSYIIPFHENILTTIRKASKSEGSAITIYSPINHRRWVDVENPLTEIVNKRHKSTNICDALNSSANLLNWHYLNYVILFASSPDNVNNMTALSKALEKWHLKYPYAYFFYVAMTEESVTDKIMKTLMHCDNMYFIDAKKDLPLFGCLNERQTIRVNTRNLDKIIKIGCSLEGEHKAQLVGENPNFNIKIENNTIKDGIIPIRIFMKRDFNTKVEKMFNEYHITPSIEVDGVDIKNPNIPFCLTNRISRSLNTYDNEVFIGDASHYDNFLFKKASIDTLYFDFNYVFNEFAKRDSANVDFSIFSPDNKSDFQVFYNGRPINNIRLIATDSLSNNIISFVFNPDAKEGDRYIHIHAIRSHNLDDINGINVMDYTLSLRAHYETEMNPVAFILLIFFGLIADIFIIVCGFIYTKNKIKRLISKYQILKNRG